MSSTAGGIGLGEDSKEQSVETDKPLWLHVTKLGKTFEGGGNVSFKCNYCGGTYKGSYSRVKSHLLKIAGHGIKMCPKITTSQLTEINKQVDEAECMIKRALPKEIPLPSTHGSSHASSSSVRVDHSLSFRSEGYQTKKRKGVASSPLEKAFSLQQREELDGEIAKMFFSAGLPFNLAKNPYYKNAFSFACNNNLAGYVPPGYNALRSKLLERERAHIETLLEPTKGVWKEKGVSLVCDGWTDPQRRPLINFMAITENYPMFIKAVNCEGEYKDKFFIANLIKEVIVMIGPSNIVQIITDNAPVCRAAGLLVEQSYPHIFWTPCVVHTLNLALKNICAAKNTKANEIIYAECHWITVVADDAVLIRNFIMNHSMRLSMFNDFSHLRMLAVAETRFASVIIMLRRFKQIKNALQSMVISEKWSCYREDDVGKARYVKEKILDDLWWDNVDYILDFTDPIYDMLREADTDKSCLYLIYEMWDSMLAKVKEIIYRHERKSHEEDSNFWSVVYTILEDRWSKSNTPLHCLAHSLNPRYIHIHLLN
ncbi:hypothetical protein KFK09_018897 [Dendrobium nobile]|uniref:DUF659 domain-containing protein n=1 Tax=Dendrobium nobile TaxID=94219 RepID=A0A8T3AX44_DENNO|nr:hypothetical protein KFK09_018897 [Dendrobium nobile]